MSANNSDLVNQSDYSKPLTMDELCTQILAEKNSDGLVSQVRGHMLAKIVLAQANTLRIFREHMDFENELLQAKIDLILRGEDATIT